MEYREIEQDLLEGESTIKRLLHERFLQARRRAKGPMALVSEHVMMTNTAAMRILDASDQSFLWEWALRAIASGERESQRLELRSGSEISADCESVHHGGMMVGALIRLRSHGPGL